MVQQVHVRPAIPIIVKEDRLRRIDAVIQPILRSFLLEGVVMLIDKKQIPSLPRSLPRDTDIDVRPAVVVDVHNTHSRTPRVGRYPRFPRDILEMHIALVEIKPGANLVSGKKEIGKPVPVEI